MGLLLAVLAGGIKYEKAFLQGGNRKLSQNDGYFYKIHEALVRDSVFNKGSFAFVSAVVIATAAEEMLTTNSITGSTLKVGSAEGRPKSTV